MIKWFKGKNKKKTQTPGQPIATLPVNNKLPGNPGMCTAGATGGNSKLDYSKLLNTPWRKFEQNGEWKKEYAEKIYVEIQEHKVNERNISNIRILLVGPVGAGKSSFMNTVASIDAGRISQITRAGGTDGSLTFALKEYRPRKLKNFRLLDTMGVEEHDKGGLNLKDVLYLVKGHIAPGYKFNPATSIDEKSNDFRQEPDDNNKIHCVVNVIEATVAGNDNISDARKRKIKELSNELKELDIPRIVLLTKIDVLCEFVDDDIANTYNSEKVQQAVRVAKELYQVKEQNIFPVKNYERETEADRRLEILPLLALRQMIYFGSDFLNSISAPTDDDDDAP